MVLESIISPSNANKKPWKMFFVGLLYSSFALIASMLLFQDFASLVLIFLTVAASIPIIYQTIKMEEQKDISLHSRKILIKQHGRALSYFVFLFLGFVVSFALWYLFLPLDTASSIFYVQENTIKAVNSPATGYAVNIVSSLSKIFINNIKVLIFCLLFSFFYGSGAIFILTWNASVIAVAIGGFIKNMGLNLHIFSLAFLKYLVHGIPEILAYFMAGLAGGIISIAIIKHDYNSPNFKKVLLDSVDLAFGAIVILFFAALIEIFVSPLII